MSWNHNAPCFCEEWAKLYWIIQILEDSTMVSSYAPETQTEIIRRTIVLDIILRLAVSHIARYLININ